MNDASRRGIRVSGALEASVDREGSRISELDLSQRVEEVKDTERFKTYLSGLSSILNVERSMRQLISQADLPRFVELLVQDCLKSRDEIEYLKETLYETKRQIARVNEKGLKGYRKLRKGIKNGLAGVTRRLERSMAEKGSYSNSEVNDVYVDGIRQLQEYAKTMDAEVPSDHSSSYGSRFDFGEDWDTDSDLDQIGGPGPGKKQKKNPGAEKTSSARKVVEVRGKKGKDNGVKPQDLEPDVEVECVSMTEVSIGGIKGDLNRSQNIKSVGRMRSPPIGGREFNLSRKPSEAIIKSGSPGLREEKSAEISYDKTNSKDETKSTFGGGGHDGVGKKPSPPRNMKWAMVENVLAKDEERILGGINVAEKANEMLEFFEREKERDRAKRMENKKKSKR